MLIVVSGTVASGKSSVSRALADLCAAEGRSSAVIDLDLVYEMLSGPGVRKDEPRSGG